jgi:hypothetical protein
MHTPAVHHPQHHPPMCVVWSPTHTEQFKRLALSQGRPPQHL